MNFGIAPFGAIPFGAGVDVGNSPPTGDVTISGTVAVGQTLTASNTLADADGLGTITYQWLLDDVDISGETGTTYTIVNTDVGGVIKVRASYTDGGGNPENKTSSGTIAVPNSTPSGSPTISGTKTEGQTLTVDTSGISDADGLGAFSYQWKRDGVAISGATSTTYVLTAFDVNTVITCTVSYTDGGGTAESLTSANYSPIAAASATTYQECYFVTTINAAYVAGASSLTNYCAEILTADIPASFLNGGSQSATNGGGNIRIYTSSTFEDVNRLAIRIDDFDINAGTAAIKFVIPTLSPSVNTDIYIVKINPDATQPAANDTYGSDNVDLYDPDLVPPADPSDLKTTYDNMDTEADFMTSSGLACSLIGDSGGGNITLLGVG